MVRHPRKELQSLLSGSATFIEDLNVSNQLQVLFLRSPFAHTRIRAIDTSGVDKAVDVAGVLKQSDLRNLVGPNVWNEYPLAETEVVYQGQPVAAIVGSKRLALEDHLERICVDYEPLPVVSEPTHAIKTRNKWLSTASSNTVFKQESKVGHTTATLKTSPHTLHLKLHIPRISPFPIEGRGIVVERTSTGTVVYSSTQSPLQLQEFLLRSTAEPGRVRVIQTAVGGAFGGKIFPYAEDLACYLISAKLRRNVKWIPLPEEKLVTLTHRPGQTHEVQVGYDSSGRILAFKDHVLVDAGAHFSGSAGASMERPGTEIGRASTAIEQMISMATGPYNIKDVEVRVTGVATNKVMMGPIRGSGGMVATFVLERVLNQIGIKLGLDQFATRRANLISGTSSTDRSPFGMHIPQLRLVELLEIAGTRGRRERWSDARHSAGATTSWG